MQQLAALLAKPPFQQAARNFGWLLAERGFRFGFGVVVGLYVARHLGPVQLGSLSYCLAVVTLFGCFAGLGLDEVIRRDLVKSPENAARLLADGLVLRLLAGLVAASGLLLYVLAGPRHTGVERIIFIFFSCLLWQPALALPELWLQARLQARYSVLAQTAALAISAAGRIWLVQVEAPLTAFAAANVLEALLAGVGLHFAARRAGLRLNWFAARWESMRRLAREAGPLALASLAIVIYMKIDEVMLRQMAGTHAVGIYAAAVRLSELWYFIPGALASSSLPALLRSRERGPDAYRERFQQFFDLNAGLAYLLAVPFWLASGWVVRVAYGPAFAEAAPVLAVHIWACVFVFLGVARGQWLVNEGLTRFYLAATLAGAVANVLLNLVLIPRWGPLGAAWATLASFALSAWLSSFAHPAVREAAGLQTRALLLPLLGWRYFKRP